MADHDQDIPAGGRESPDRWRAGRPGPPGEPPPEEREEEAAAEKQRSTARKVLRTIAIAIASLIGGVMVLLLLFVLALQTNWGGTHFADFLLAIANPFDEAQTEYDALRGNFITRLEFEDLRMYRLDTVYVDTLQRTPPRVRRVPKDSLASPNLAAAFDTMLVDTLLLASIDTFRLRYDLLSLLSRRVEFNEIYAANPILRARQRADSTWDLLQPFAGDTTQTGAAPFEFEIEDLDITNGDLLAIYNPPDRDSVFQVRNFTLHARNVEIADVISASVDTLFGRYSPPGQEYFTEVRTSGVLVENELDLAGLVIESPQSYVTAEGRLRLPMEEDEGIEDVHFELTADPIVFQDLHPFLPTLNPRRSATLNVDVTGSSDLLNVDAAGDLSDGGSFTLAGRLSPTVAGPVQYAAEGRVQSFDPTFFTSEGPSETQINARIDVDLSGFDLQNLDGDVTASFSSSTLGGLELASAQFDARFDGGVADLDLTSTWNGSTVVAEGTASPFAETPTYDLQGRTTNFNLASLGIENQETDVDAVFGVQGSGFDPQTAEIEGSIDLAPSTINAYAVNDGTVQFALANGDLTYGVRFLFPDGMLAANGSARFEDPLHVTVERGRFENVDLAALIGAEVQSSLNGTFRAEATGSDPQEMTAEAVLDMETSTYGEYRLQDGTVSLNLNDGLLSMVAVADLAEAGYFDFAAVTRPFDDTPTFNVTRGEFTNVDVGALFGMPEQESALTGTATFTVRGFDAQTMRLDGEISLVDSRINEQQITAATAAVNLRQGVVTFDGNVEVPEGSAQLAGTVRPFRDVPTYEVTQGQFQNINLAAFTGNPNLESSLDGTLSITGTGFEPETMNLQGTITLTDSRLNQQQINAASVTGRLVDGRFDVEASLDVPDGQTRLAGTIQPFQEVPTYTIREGSFGGIDIGALTGSPDLDTNLQGNVSLSGRGFDPETMNVEGTIRFDQSVINGATLTQGTVSGDLVNGFAQFDAMLDFAEGSAQFEGSGQLFREVPTYQAEGTVSNLNLADIVGNDTLQARLTAAFDVEGTGLDPRTMNLQGRIVSSDAAYEGAEVDTLYAQFLLDGGVLNVDSLLLRSTAADLRGSGIIAVYDTTTASNFAFVADVRNLDPIEGLLGAELELEEGYLEGRVYGRPGTLRFDVAGRLHSFIYDDIRISEFEGTIAGEIGPDRELTLAELEGEFQAVSLPQFLVQSADLNLTYTPEGIAFVGTVQLDDERIGEVAGFVETGPEAQRIVLEQLHLQLDGQDWSLLQEASISYGEEYRIRNLLLYSGDQQLAIDGVIDPDGEQNLVMTIESFDIGPFADILGYQGLDALVNGSLLLSGPAAAPDMSGTLTAEVDSEDRDVGDLRLILDYDALRLQIDALLAHQDGSSLTVVGSIPLDLRVARLSEGGVEGGLTDRSINFTLEADSFGIGFVEPFLDPETVDELSGRLSANIDVSGTLDDPILDGTARYSGGRVGIPELGLTYTDIQAGFVLDQNEVAVNDFIIRSGGGEIRGDGTILMPELTLGEFNIDLVADEFLAIDSHIYRFVVNGDMVLSGTTQLPEVQGDAEVISGEILLTEETTGPELAQVQLSEEALQTVERRFGVHVTEEDTTTFSLYNALAMDLDVEIERDTWIRSQVNPAMDVQFAGDLDLVKQHYEDVNIYGTIEVVPQRSRLVQFGKRFDITSGTLTFSGPAADPLINIEAEHDVRRADVTVTLGLEGRMSERLDLTLGSNPQLENTDILSYLATGYPASQGLQLGGRDSGILGAGGQLAFGELQALVSGIAEAGLGLDVVTIELLGGEPQLTAGSYVTSRLFVSVSQPIGDPSDATGETGGAQPTITVEYEITNWLLLQLLQQAQGLHLNLQWEYSY